MYQNKEIIGLMKGTIPYTNKTLFYLSDLIMKYPYFQTAHVLHTLNLQYLKDTDFLFDLRKTSVYLQDRKQLLFKIEDEFFIPELMEAIESENETFPLDSSFELIDVFLSGGNVKDDDLNNIVMESSPVTIDYLTSFISEEMEDEEAPQFQYQDTIDKFLEKDAISPLKIRLDKKSVFIEDDFNKNGEPEEELVGEYDFPSDEYFPPEQLPDQLNSESFFSETLAKIYIKKKKYSKALEIIRKINLLYPEKNRYFADQIRFLEKLINNTNNKK